MDSETLLQSKARHLHIVEGLSLTQTAKAMGISRKKITRLIRRDSLSRKVSEKIITPYERLIRQWYEERPYLQAMQVFERLKGYGYEGGYTPVKQFTLPFRGKKKARAYHELVFLPGEEAQVDWMQRTMPFGVVYGFVYILSYSRYLYGRFYLRCSMEFFLDGHLEAFRELNGVVQRHRYDNLRSVVVKRQPEPVYNARFMDFARHFSFQVHACTPRRPNEKGRVERVIQDIGNFMNAMEFTDLNDLNKKFGLWRNMRNGRIHRTTQRTPADMLQEEKLTPLPKISYKPYRHEPAVVSKTCFVTLDTNRYSVPTAYSEKACDLFVYPQHIEVVIDGKIVATHQRVFEKRQKIEHPGHRERLLEHTPRFKQKRMYQLLQGMDVSFEHFLKCAEQEGQDPLLVAHELFKLLKGSARATLISAVTQANSNSIYRVSYLQSLLRPSEHQEHPVHPQDHGLLNITYEGRNLSEYDTLI